MKKFKKSLLIMVVLFYAVALFWPRPKGFREVPPDEACKDHMRSLSNGLKAYHEETGRPISSVVFDEEGYSQSWRIILLRQMKTQKFQEFLQEKQVQ